MPNQALKPTVPPPAGPRLSWCVRRQKESSAVHSEQRRLLDEATVWIERFLKEQGAFASFGLALFTDGKVSPIQSTDEFPDEQARLTAMLETLVGLAQSGEVTATVLCTPMSAGKDKAIVFDVEQKSSQRVIAVQGYKKLFLGGWRFGEKEYRDARARVFTF